MGIINKPITGGGAPPCGDLAIFTPYLKVQFLWIVRCFMSIDIWSYKFWRQKYCYHEKIKLMVVVTMVVLLKFITKINCSHRYDHTTAMDKGSKLNWGHATTPFPAAKKNNITFEDSPVGSCTLNQEKPWQFFLVDPKMFKTYYIPTSAGQSIILAGWNL